MTVVIPQIVADAPLAQALYVSKLRIDWLLVGSPSGMQEAEEEVNLALKGVNRNPFRTGGPGRRGAFHDFPKQRIIFRQIRRPA